MVSLEPRINLGMRQVKFLGPFEVQGLLTGLRAWLDDRNYDIEENPFKYRKSGEGFVLETKWKCYQKTTPFVKKWMNIQMRIDSIKDIEITVGGKKIKMQHGRGLIEVTPEVEFGWQKWWEKHKTLLKWYLTYFYHHQYWGEWVDGHFYEAMDLLREIRRLLNFEVQ